MQPAISQLCTLNSLFEDDLKGYADATGAAVEFWLTKLETYLQTHTTEEVVAFCSDRELHLAAATYHGGLLLSQGDARRENWSQFERRLELCRAVGIPTLILTPDFLGPFSQTDIERAQVTLKQAGCEVEMARYPGGSHLFMRAGPPEHREDVLGRVLAWFEAHL